MANWSADLSVGNPMMDEDHRHLVLLVNELDHAVRTGRRAETRFDILHDVVLFSGQHFCREERLMRQSGYPGMSEHKRAHDALIRDLREFVRAFEGGEIDISADTVTWLKTWVSGHILGADRALAAYLSQQPALAESA